MFNFAVLKIEVILTEGTHLIFVYGKCFLNRVSEIFWVKQSGLVRKMLFPFTSTSSLFVTAVQFVYLSFSFESLSLKKGVILVFWRR